jgi:hypothetical protein
MKAKTALTTFLAGVVSISAFSQNIEIDDIYFNSRDRAKLNEKKASADIARLRNTEERDALNSTINPSDSYSARNINPEYDSQSILEGDANYTGEDYFVPNYQPTGVNQNLSNSSNWNSSPFNNNYYSNNYYNPYGYNQGFGSFYPSMWGSPYGFNNGPGWNMSLGYGWGGWSPGWYGGMGYGWGNSWNPWNSFYNGWGGNYYGYGYPSQVIIINGGDNNSRIAYGKRPSRSSTIDHQLDRSRAQVTYSRSDPNNSGGRTRSETPAYYERGWKRNPATNPNRSFWSFDSNNNNSNTRSTFSTFGNNNNAGRQRSSGFSSPSPTRSSFSPGSSNSGSRSSSSGSSGTRSSSSSGTRGRNN